MIQALMMVSLSMFIIALFHSGNGTVFRWTDNVNIAEVVCDIAIYLAWLLLSLMPIVAQVANATGNNEPTYLLLMLLFYLPVYMVTLLQFKYRVSFYKP